MKYALALSLFTTAAVAAPAAIVNRASAANPADFEELHEAALLASAAYSGCTGSAFDTTITAQLDDSSTDTQGFIGYNATTNRIVTIFRGSTTPQDFENDLDVLPVTPSLSGVSFPDGVQVMNGIFSPYSSVHDSVIGNITALLQQYPSATLEIAGHSLGGSLTYLAHTAISQNFPGVTVQSRALAAFAIGNDAFADWASGLPDATLWRGNQLDDGVPNLFPLFTHYGTEYYGIGTADSELVCDGELDLSCSAGNGQYGVTPGHVTNSGVIMLLAGCG